MRILRSLVLCLTALSITRLDAGEPQLIQYEAPPVVRSCFEKGRWNAAMLFEGHWSFSPSGPRPKLNYVQGSFRFGRMMTDVKGQGFWRGNYELVGEMLYAGVTEGPGGWVSGGNIMLRRNFVPSSNEKLTWYAQLGGGIVANDIYKDMDQTLIGRCREFSIVAGLGVRYQLRNDWFLLFEGNYRHLSNADTAVRNTGHNSFGGGIGIGRNF